MSIATLSPAARPQPWRAFLVRQTVLWHWTSSAVCLGAMLLFTVTGITLNHAADIPSTPVVTSQRLHLPAHLLPALAAAPTAGKHPLPAALAPWLTQQIPESRHALEVECSDAELYLSLPKPGGDGWVSIKRPAGIVEAESTDRGWISYLNDLHKGRHTGRTWQVFIDVIAVAFLIFTATGLVLLQIHARKRPTTWPAILLGFAAPTLLLIFFLHR